MKFVWAKRQATSDVDDCLWSSIIMDYRQGLRHSVQQRRAEVIMLRKTLCSIALVHIHNKSFAKGARDGVH